MDVQITPELLAELKEKAEAALADSNDIKVVSSVAEEELALAASPATVLALIEHIRSLCERLEKATTNQARYHWLVHQGDSCQWMNIIKVDPDDFESYDEAIDAAIAQEGAEHE